MSVQVGQPVELGLASTVKLAVIGGASTAISVTSAAVIFEGKSESTTISTYGRDSFFGPHVGVIARDSSLAEGQIVITRENNTWIQASKLGQLRLADDSDDYLVSEELNTLAAMMTDAAEVYVMPITHGRCRSSKSTLWSPSMT